MQDLINKIKDYPDKEIYKQDNYLFDNNTTINVSGCTISNPDKLNEDTFFYLVDKEIIWAGVFDGCTSLKPISALGDLSGARFASHFIKQLIPELNLKVKPKDLILNINEKLLETSLKLGGDLIDTHTLPSTTGTIIKLDISKNKMEYAHVGDSFGLLYKQKGESEHFTNDLNKKFDQGVFDKTNIFAKEKHLTFREARELPEVKQLIIEMFNIRNNNPNGKGSGLINGDPNINKYIQSGTIELSEYKYIFLGTDGIIPPGWSNDSLKDRENILKAINVGGFQNLIKIKKQIEDNDPEWILNRYKHSDDATGILIKL